MILKYKKKKFDICLLYRLLSSKFPVKLYSNCINTLYKKVVPYISMFPITKKKYLYQLLRHKMCNKKYCIDIQVAFSLLTNIWNTQYSLKQMFISVKVVSLMLAFKPKISNISLYGHNLVIS